MRHHFQAEQWLPFPVEQIFLFFANPDNLPRLMPPWQRAKIEEASITAPPARLSSLQMPARSIAAGAGTRMTISFRPFPFSPVRASWDAEITEFVWDEHFCDVQHRGPFAFWRHCHRMQAETRANASGEPVVGSLLRDAIEYELPFGVLGDLAQRLVIKRQLASTFAYRQRRTAELLPLT